MLELTGRQQRQLRDALIAAFPAWGQLAELTQYQLDLNLATITGESGGLNEAAFHLVQWASSRGTLYELIVAARNERPKHARVNELADLLGLSCYPSEALEKFVNANVVMLDVAAWREGQAHAEWRVCRIDCGGQAVGTGSLVGPDLVLTNHHVVEALIGKRDSHPAWRARFDHKVTPDGKDLVTGRAIAFATDWDVDHSRYSNFDLEPDPKGGDPTDDELDYALIRLAEPIGDQPVGASQLANPRGWITLSDQPIDYAAHRMIAILQHPRGRPMKLAMGMLERLTLNPGRNRIRHGVPTEEGASGAPVFDQDWNLIAIHHAGDPRTVKPEYNEAIPIGLIAKRPKVAAALDGAGRA